jgi:hypothetical protein
MGARVEYAVPDREKKEDDPIMTPPPTSRRHKKVKEGRYTLDRIRGGLKKFSGNNTF